MMNGNRDTGWPQVKLDRKSILHIYDKQLHAMYKRQGVEISS